MPPDVTAIPHRFQPVCDGATLSVADASSPGPRPSPEPGQPQCFSLLKPAGTSARVSVVNVVAPEAKPMRDVELDQLRRNASGHARSEQLDAAHDHAPNRAREGRRPCE